MPEIKIKERLAPHMDDLVANREDINLILRCTECHTFLLPQEINMLKAPARDMNGQRTWVVFQLCPACHPNYRALRHDEVPPQSFFITLNREEYEITRKYERAGLLSPIKNDALNKSSLIQTIN